MAPEPTSSPAPPDQVDLNDAENDREVALGHALKVIADRREEFSAQRFVPRDVVALLKQAGVYRSSAPKVFGGDAQPPHEFLEIVERISRVDPSTGWVASFGSALVYLAALPYDTQAELYSDGPDVAFAAGLFPIQPATPTDRGYLLNGRWKFASGSMGADVLGVGIPGDDGKPRTAVLRPGQVTIHHEWDVAGMRATGSFDLEVRSVEVAREWTFVRGSTATIEEPLYRYPAIAYASQVLAVVALGAARAALDFGLEEGSGHAGVTGAPKLAARAYYRTDIAKAEASLRSARAFFYEITRETWDLAVAGDEIPARQSALLRLAATRAAEVGSSVVQDVYGLSGTAAIYSSHPVQNLLRDAAVVPQHAFLGPATYDSVGAVLMGMAPTTPGFI